MKFWQNDKKCITEIIRGVSIVINFMMSGVSLENDRKR